MVVVLVAVGLLRTPRQPAIIRQLVIGLHVCLEDLATVSLADVADVDVAVLLVEGDGRAATVVGVGDHVGELGDAGRGDLEAQEVSRGRLVVCPETDEQGTVRLTLRDSLAHRCRLRVVCRDNKVAV